jgi:hypothetical protein
MLMTWVSILLSGLIGGVLGTLVTFLFSWRSTWTSYSDTANKIVLELDSLFIAHFDLRKFFYDNCELSKNDDTNYPRALAAREFVADSLEAICDKRHVYKPEDWASWLEYVEEIMDTSPTLTELINTKGKDWYPSLSAALGHEPRPRLPRLREFWGDVWAK